MTDPLVNVQRLLDDWERDAVEKAARYESMRQGSSGSPPPRRPRAAR